MGKKILLADDSITIQKVIELTFSDEDFEVVTVGNGRLAIEKVQDVRPDVVLCDIIMPEKDGYEVCDFVKKNPALSHIPVLLLTGAFEPFDQDRAARVGCDGFLAKPFEPQALIAKVKDLLRQAESRKPAAAAPAPVPPPVSEPVAEPSPAATVWAAPSPVVSPGWDAPQTRPGWSASPSVPLPPPPPAPAEPSGVHFIPEDPFVDDASVGFGPATGDTVRVPSFPEETFDSAPEVEPEPYVLEPGAPQEDDLLPMTPDEEESLAPDAMAWDEPAAEPAAREAAAATSTASERDLFLEEVFDEAAAAVEAAHSAASAAPHETGPEPEPAAHPTPEPQEAEAAAPLAAAQEPEPEPELEPEPEPEEEPIRAAAPEPVSAAPPAAPEPEPPVPPPAMAEAAPAADDLELEEDESFADVSPATAAPAAAAAPAASEAGAVAVPMDMVSQIAQRVVAQISEKVIREIAWEVIPDMAEALIKREIERLTAELQQG